MQLDAVIASTHRSVYGYYTYDFVIGALRSFFLGTPLLVAMEQAYKKDDQFSASFLVVARTATRGWVTMQLNAAKDDRVYWGCPLPKCPNCSAILCPKERLRGLTPLEAARKRAGFVFRDFKCPNPPCRKKYRADRPSGAIYSRAINTGTQPYVAHWTSWPVQTLQLVLRDGADA